jgi:hypothetical protein
MRCFIIAKSELRRRTMPVYKTLQTYSCTAVYHLVQVEIASRVFNEVQSCRYKKTYINEADHYCSVNI